jgi:hypothetical protein
VQHGVQEHTSRTSGYVVGLVSMVTSMRSGSREVLRRLDTADAARLPQWGSGRGATAVAAVA